MAPLLYSLHLSDRKAKKQREKEAEEQRGGETKAQREKEENTAHQSPPPREKSNNLQNFLAADLLNMLNSADKTYQAYKLAEARLHLAKVAQRLYQRRTSGDQHKQAATGNSK